MRVLEAQLITINRRLEELREEEARVARSVQTLRNIERAKAEIQLDHGDRIVQFISKAHEDTKASLEKEVKAIGKEYDTSIKDNMDTFIESVSVNDSPLRQLEREFKVLDNLMTDLDRNLEQAQADYLKVYEERKGRLVTALDRVITVLNRFLAARNATAEKINSLQLDIQVDRPTVINIPFWVYGIADGQKEHLTVMPVSTVVPLNRVPTLEEPYVPHMAPLGGTDFLGTAQLLLQRSNLVDKARSATILPEAPSIIGNLEHLARRNILYGRNGERFIKAVTKFLLGQPVRESPYVPPHWWSYDEYEEMNE
jgi:hypothetical protein